MATGIFITDTAPQSLLWGRSLFRRAYADLARRYPEAPPRVDWAFPEEIRPFARHFLTDMPEIRAQIPYGKTCPLDVAAYDRQYDTRVPANVHTGLHRADHMAQAAGIPGAGALLPMARTRARVLYSGWRARRRRNRLARFTRAPGFQEELSLYGEDLLFLPDPTPSDRYVGVHLPTGRSSSEDGVLAALQAAAWPRKVATLGVPQEGRVRVGEDFRSSDLTRVLDSVRACSVVVAPGWGLLAHYAAALGRRTLAVWGQDPTLPVTHGAWIWGLAGGADWFEPRQDDIANWLQSALVAEGLSTVAGDPTQRIFRND